MNHPTTTQTAGEVYESVQFGGKNGKLKVSPSGITFYSLGETGEDAFVKYQASWNVVRKFRLNSANEPDALLRLVTSADYGEGCEEETSVFELPNRTDLEKLEEGIRKYWDQYEKKPSLLGSRSDQTDSTRSVTDISSISCTEYYSMDDELTPEGKSLVLMVYEHLIAASERARRDFARGVVDEHPDRTLRTIYEKEQERLQTHAAARSDDEDHDCVSKSARPDPGVPSGVKDRLGQSSDEENDSDQNLSTKAHKDDSMIEVFSMPSIREPKLLAGHSSSSCSPLKRSDSGNSGEVRSTAKRTELQDKEAKERARRLSLSSSATAHVVSGRNVPATISAPVVSQVPAVSQAQVVSQAAITTVPEYQPEVRDSGTVSSLQSQPQHEELKQHLLTMLQQNSTEGPGAFQMRPGCHPNPPVGTATSDPSFTQVPSEPEYNVLSDCHLIEAYLVAQSCHSSKAPEPPRNHEAKKEGMNEDFQAVAPSFWELSELEFLEALEKVMMSKCTEAVPVAAQNMEHIASLKAGASKKSLGPLIEAVPAPGTKTTISASSPSHRLAQPTTTAPTAPAENGCCNIL